MILHRSHAPDQRLACPDLGSASIWAEARGRKITNIVALQGHTVRSRLATRMQTVKSYVRTQSPSVKEGCAALDPSSPPAVTDQVARTSSDGSQDGRSGVSSSMSLIAAALKPRSILIATDFSEASEKALRYSLALARFYESKFCLAHVVSSLGLTMAGPDAIAACEEATSCEAAELEDSLIQAGALTGIQHKFIVRQGELWPELQGIIRQENADLLVVGTHGRHGIAKLFFGSIAEQIFRQASCPVLTFGPYCDDRPWFGTSSTPRTFLFATDFGPASLHGLPQAIAAANQFGAKLAFLSIVPPAPSHADEELRNCQVDARDENHAAFDGTRRPRRPRPETCDVCRIRISEADKREDPRNR